MEEEIVNRVAQSKLVTFDLQDYYPEGERILIDIKDWLYEGLVLREKEFRDKAKTFNWQQFKNAYVALTCTSDAVIPAWAFMLLSTYLNDFAKKVVIGSLDDLETLIYQDIIESMDFQSLEGLPVIVKGCSHKPIPKNAYIFLLKKLQPLAKSIMYGEACSAVPLFKGK